MIHGEEVFEFGKFRIKWTEQSSVMPPEFENGTAILYSRFDAGTDYRLTDERNGFGRMVMQRHTPGSLVLIEGASFDVKTVKFSELPVDFAAFCNQADEFKTNKEIQFVNSHVIDWGSKQNL